MLSSIGTPTDDSDDKSNEWVKKILDVIRVDNPDFYRFSKKWVEYSVSVELSAILALPNADVLFPKVLEQLCKVPNVQEIVQQGLIQQDSQYNTPLDTAVQNAHWLSARLLLAFPNANEQLKSRYLEFDSWPERTLTLLVMKSRDDQLIGLYLTLVDPNKPIRPPAHKTQFAITPLIGLIRLKKYKLFKSVVEQSPFVIDFQVLDREQRGLLHNLVCSMDASDDVEAIVDFLLTKGLHPESKDVFGYTPVDYALFYGTLAVASRLSGFSEEALKKDPRYLHPPAKMGHQALVDNIMAYVKLKHEQTKDKDIQLTLPNIDQGLCNGWGILAAVMASNSDDTDKNIQRFYRMMEVMCEWDKKTESLTAIPDDLKDEFKTLDDMFHHVTHEMYMLFQQQSVNIGVPSHEREKQVAILSDKVRLKRTADFSLTDMNEEELIEILNDYSEIADHTIIDMSSFNHATVYYQKSSDAIYYLDPNPLYALPSFRNYQQAATSTVIFQDFAVRSIGYFYRSNETSSGLQEKTDKITDGLIRKLILNHPKRKGNLKDILLGCTQHGSSHLLTRLLHHSEVKPLLTPQILAEIAKSVLCDPWGTGNTPAYNSIYVLYQHGIDLGLLEDNLLGVFLKTAIYYDDEPMFLCVKEILEKLPQERKQSLSESLAKTGNDLNSLMQFDISGNYNKRLKQ